MIRRTSLAILALLLPTLAATAQVEYQPRVAPFPVHDLADSAFAQPFLGGYDVPRPQLVDIDGDGDLDLFVQERSGEIIFFERVGDEWVWRTDRFHDLDVGDWYRFVDLDGDDLPDLLGESRYSYIRAWRNVGTRTAARFEVMADSLADYEGTPIFADRQNILNLVDIDCNGLLDLFIGKVEGVIDRYEMVDRDPSGMPRFALVTHRWEGIEILGGVPGAMLPRPSLHGANTMSFGDVDGDGDVDLLWGDFFEPGLLLIRNNGTSCADPMFRGTPEAFPAPTPLATSGYNAPTLGDVDADGDADLVMGVIGGAFVPRTTAIDNLYLVEQTEPGVFEVRTSRLVQTVDVGSESIPVLADLDGDGDLDLLIGNKIDPAGQHATLTWFENTGSATAPVFRDRGVLASEHEYQVAPAVGDLDGDGLPDLVLGSWRDQLQFWRNTGTRGSPVWTLADSALIRITRGSNTTPTLGDIDGDGDLDLIIGESTGQLNLYRNDGTASAPDFTLVSDNFQGIDVGRRSVPVLIDVDGDGLPDLVIGSEEGVVQLWLNRTAGGEIRFEHATRFVVQSDGYAAPAVGDIDGDGDLDLIVGTAAGGLRYFEAVSPTPE